MPNPSNSDRAALTTPDSATEQGKNSEERLGTDEMGTVLGPRGTPL